MNKKRFIAWCIWFIVTFSLFLLLHTKILSQRQFVLGMLGILAYWTVLSSPVFASMFEDD